MYVNISIVVSDKRYSLNEVTAIKAFELEEHHPVKAVVTSVVDFVEVSLPILIRRSSTIPAEASS